MISVPVGDPRSAVVAVVGELNSWMAAIEARLTALEDAATAAKAFPYPPKEEDAKDKS